MTDTVPVPAVRPPVDKPMRLVGVSHSNNSYSLVDHASANDQLHHIFLVVKQHVAGILADVQYYKIAELKSELIALGNDVAALERDRSFEESRNKYHRHFWRADDEAENKQLIVKLSEVAYALLDYKQNCCTESRGPYALDEAKLETLCKKHLYELQNFRRELAQFVNTARERNSQVTRLSAPLQSELEWYQYKSPLDDPNIRRPLPYECTLTSRETIRPRTEPPEVDGHISGVKHVPSQWDVPNLSGKPGAANSGTTGNLTKEGKYGGRHIYERNINERRKPFEQEVQHVSSRYKHYHGLCLIVIVDPRAGMYKLQKQERLLNAVEMGDIYEVQTCLDSGAGINDVPWGTESLLMRAIRCKHKEVAKFLINKGIDVNYVYVKSDSPRSETKNFRQETAREYAEFYDMPEIIELIDARRIRLQATP